MYPRKQQSGFGKRAKKRKIEELIESQKGAIDRFIVKETKNVDQILEVDKNEDVEELRQNEHDMLDNQNDTSEDVDDKYVKENDTHEDVDGLIHNRSIPFNIYDPRTWDNLDIKYRDLLVANGPTRDLSLEKGPKDNLSRCFSASHYTRYLSSAKNCLAFRGTNERPLEDSNGNFLGLIEMITKWDPIMKEHMRRIESNEIQYHYLSHKIQNELVVSLASKIKSTIIKKIKEAKYFSVILDCTPDTSHQEQMSLILRCEDLSRNPIKIHEYFVEFLKVDNTTGQGLFEELQNTLITLNLDINDVRGQGYDNGCNMKALCDMANSCVKAKDFFGAVQGIYNLFSNSTKRWKILKDNVKTNVKPLSATRWESHVEAIKAIRFQAPELREALLEVAEIENDNDLRCRAKALATLYVGNFEFLVAMIIWESGFNDAINIAKQITIEMKIDPLFQMKHIIRRKKHFDENATVEDAQSPEDSFRTNYFFYIVDQAIGSLERRRFISRVKSFAKSFTKRNKDGF
ncbi:zinc finger MYM-type protein 1-like [Olea europaea var. sylvestris]|uniref:zinc finger MYM-type protein 1-like n=1 Tax=Olea europaea var. sylvestris TaxID=158386 RepID=UPI000C1D159F|nr:zinc finger MYM-type protein 1-like [Olea europaea var. sylvestris]